MKIGAIRLELIDDWKRVAPKLWSVRWALVSAVISSGQAGFEFYVTGQAPWVSITAAVLSFASAISRIIAQPKVFDGSQ
jgi:membrane protein YdbS with pleckstrin-like domain